MTYNLTQTENEKWFQSHILPKFADCAQISKEPTFTLLTGQPWSGKTCYSRRCASKMETYPILFGADDLRIMHPRAQEVLKNDEKTILF